jgi:RNA polymerase sigma-70 factor, ECF subfamily
VNPEERDDFERLYRRHRAEIFRYLLRTLGNKDDADDATQDAFLSALGAIERNGPPRQPRPWLYAIADNLRRRIYRRRADRPLLVALETAADKPEPERTAIAADVARALEELPHRQAEVLAGREIAGLSYAELADRLDLSEPAVQMLLFRARKRFRESFAWLPLFRFGESSIAGEPIFRAAALMGAAAIGTAVVGISGDAPAAQRAVAATPLVQVEEVHARTRAHAAPTSAPPQARPFVRDMHPKKVLLPPVDEPAPPAAAPETQPGATPSGAATGSAVPAASTPTGPAPSSNWPAGVAATTPDVPGVVTSPVTAPALSVTVPELPAQPPSVPSQIAGTPVAVPSLGK